MVGSNRDIDTWSIMMGGGEKGKGLGHLPHRVVFYLPFNFSLAILSSSVNASLLPHVG